MTGLPTKCVGRLDSTAVLTSDGGGIDSTTYVSTGKYRVNFETSYEVGEVYPATVDIQATNPAGTNYWARPAVLNKDYLEIILEYGNPFTFVKVNRPVSFECLQMTMDAEDNSLPILCGGIITGGGTLINSTGVDSTTYVSTGEVKINYTDAGAFSDVAFVKPSLGPSSNAYWANTGQVQTGYLQISSQYGNPAVFAKVNPTHLTFKVLDIT